MPIIMLADNGSVRATATLQLRSLATNLGEKIHQIIFPVSLKHADRKIQVGLVYLILRDGVP